jgi:hypothetical protein
MDAAPEASVWYRQQVSIRQKVEVGSPRIAIGSARKDIAGTGKAPRGNNPFVECGANRAQGGHYKIGTEVVIIVWFF